MGAPKDKSSIVWRVVGFSSLLFWIAAHLFWVFRTEINWDEFALLARAHDSLMTGQLMAGGRPGLGTLLLMPVVDGCHDTLVAVRRARLFWTFFDVGILVGLWGILTQLLRKRPEGRAHAFVGVAFVALLPAFLRYSIQVRSDQPAIAFGLLGGVLLIRARRPLLGALGAGAMFALGFAASQKLVYVAALVVLLAVADLCVNHQFRLRREVVRLVALLVGGLATLATFRGLTSLVVEPPAIINVGGQMNVFGLYRSSIGYGHYLRMLPELFVPLSASLLMLVVAVFVLMRERERRAEAGTIVAVISLGLAVAAFHAGAFPYFWMTLALFPATAIALGLPLLHRFWSVSVRRRIYVFVGTVFLATAMTHGARMSRDGQRIQRETEEFVTANFDEGTRGFHPTRGLFCEETDTLFPTYFSQNIYFDFFTEGGKQS